MQLNDKTFELTVSIGDAPKALRALRSYGLSEITAQEIINKESVVAIHEHGIIPKTAISPQLIEIFGEQHIDDAVSYAYLFMDEYDLDWESYYAILNTLLEVFRAEELIVNPEKIRFFINSLFTRIRRHREYNSLIKLLYNLETKDIIEMSTDPLDKEDLDDPYADDDTDDE